MLSMSKTSRKETFTWRIWAGGRGIQEQLRDFLTLVDRDLKTSWRKAYLLFHQWNKCCSERNKKRSQEKIWLVELEIPVSRKLHIKMIRILTQVIKNGESKEPATWYMNREALVALSGQSSKWWGRKADSGVQTVTGLEGMHTHGQDTHLDIYLLSVQLQSSWHVTGWMTDVQ